MSDPNTILHERMKYISYENVNLIRGGLKRFLGNARGTKERQGGYEDIKLEKVLSGEVRSDETSLNTEFTYESSSMERRNIFNIYILFLLSINIQ